MMYAGWIKYYPGNVRDNEDHRIQNEMLGMIGDVCRQLHILILIFPLSYPLHMFYTSGPLGETSQMCDGA